MHGVGRTVLKSDVRPAGLNGGKSEPKEAGCPLVAGSQIVNGRGQQAVVRSWVYVIFVFGEVLDAPRAEPCVAGVAGSVDQGVVRQCER